MPWSMLVSIAGFILGGHSEFRFAIPSTSSESKTSLLLHKRFRHPLYSGRLKRCHGTENSLLIKAMGSVVSLIYRNGLTYSDKKADVSG
jgi:hypothetical protein